MFIKTTSHSETEGQASEREGTLGSFLKTARESQGLTLATISQETRINTKSLIALEGNNRADLPADVFSRGFVKLYAAYLKLDILEALRLYEKQWGTNGSFSHPIALQKSSSSLAWPGIIMSLLLIALFFGGRIYYPGQSDDSGSRPMPDSLGKGSNELSSPPSSPGVDGNKDAANSPAAAPQETKTTEESVPPTINQAAAVPTDTSSQNQVTQTPPYEIRLQSTKKTKIKLTLDGQSVIEKNLRPGSSQAWQAAKAFDLTVDSTAGINLTVNGTTIPITSDAGQTVTIHRP